MLTDLRGIKQSCAASASAHRFHKAQEWCGGGRVSRGVGSSPPDRIRCIPEPSFGSEIGEAFKVGLAETRFLRAAGRLLEQQSHDQREYVHSPEE